MAPSVFAVSVFFVVLRESLQVGLTIAVLLSLVQQFLHNDTAGSSDRTGAVARLEHDSTPVSPRVLRKLWLQVLLGTLVGLVISLAIGAAFIGVWYTQGTDLWSNSEQVWEGVFELIASLVLFVLGITVLKVENARTECRTKFHNAYSGQQYDRGVQFTKWILFILPMITVLRDGVEAIIFIGGVSLGEPATAIPLPAIVAIIVGIISAVALYLIATRASFKIFLVFMANFILLMGAGLFSRAVWAFQENAFFQLIGGVTSDEAIGTGPGTYNVQGNVWYLDYFDANNSSWIIFNAIFGWENNGTLGSVLSYVFYWLAVIFVLVYYKFQEGRTKLFGMQSANGKQSYESQLAAKEASRESASEKDSQSDTAATGQTGSQPGL